MCRRCDETGRYDTAQETERAVHLALALPPRVDGVRAQLAARPPRNFSLIPLKPAAQRRSTPSRDRPTRAAAGTGGATEQIATRDPGAAPSAVAGTADEDLTGQILLPLRPPPVHLIKPEVPRPALP